MEYYLAIERNELLIYNEWTSKVLGQKKKPDTKYFVWYIKYLYEMSRKWKSIETESVLVVAYGRVSQT